MPEDKYTATVGGVKVSANSAKELSAIVAAIRSTQATSAPKPKPTPKAAAQPTPAAEPKKIEKWSTEQVIDQLSKDPHGAILAIIQQAVGYDLPERLEFLNQRTSAVGYIAARSAAVSALQSNKIPVNEENIKEISSILQAREGTDQARLPTLDNYSSVAAEAVKEKWLKAEEPAESQPKQGKKAPQPQADDDEANPLDFDLSEADPGGGRDLLPDFDPNPMGEDDSEDSLEVAKFAETAPIEKLQELLGRYSA